MQHNRRGGGEWPACYGRRRNDLPRPILIFVAAKENGSACYDRRCNDLPRPILIFFAAIENSSACSSRSDNDLSRPILILSKRLRDYVQRPDSKKGQQGNSPLSLFYKMP